MTLYKTSQSFTFKPPPRCLYLQSHLHISVEGLFSFCFENLGKQVMQITRELPHLVTRASQISDGWFRFTPTCPDLFWQTLNLSTPLCRSGKGPLRRQEHVLAGPSLTSAFSFGLPALMSSDSVCENKP